MWRRVLPRASEDVGDGNDQAGCEHAAEDGGDGAYPGFAGAEAGGEFAFAEGAAEVECGNIAGPDADHEEEDKGGAVLLLPEEGNEGEGVGDVDEAEESLRRVGEDLIEGRTKAVPGKEYEGEAAEDRELGFDGEVGKGDDEGQGSTEGHPPDGDAELDAMGVRADGGQLEVLVGGQLGDDGGEESDHPELAEEDEGEDGEDEDCGGEDSFHCALDRIYAARLLIGIVLTYQDIS